MDTERKAFAARAVAIGILLFSGRGTADACTQASWGPTKSVKILVSTGAGGIAQ